MRSHGNLPGFLCLRRKDSKEKNALDWNATSLALRIYPPSAVISGWIRTLPHGNLEIQAFWGAGAGVEPETKSTWLSLLPALTSDPAQRGCWVSWPASALWEWRAWEWTGCQPGSGCSHMRAGGLRYCRQLWRGSPQGVRVGFNPGWGRERRACRGEAWGVSDLLGNTGHLPIKEMPSSLPFPAQEFSNKQKKNSLYTCFTMLCQLLLYDNVNQLYEYTYPLPHGLSSPTISSL